MRAELYLPDDPETTVAVATWSGGRAYVEPTGRPVEGLDTLLRPTPVVVDDPSLRRPGTHGASLLEPGSGEWFRAALLTRAEAVGLAVRFVAGRVEGGWDPAQQFGGFEERVDRLTSS
jgi:hypothetical protein